MDLYSKGRRQHLVLPTRYDSKRGNFHQLLKLNLPKRKAMNIKYLPNNPDVGQQPVVHWMELLVKPEHFLDAFNFSFKV